MGNLEILFPVKYEPAGEYQATEIDGFAKNLRGLRDAAWVAFILGRERVPNWEEVSGKIRRGIIDLMFSIKSRRKVLMNKVDAVLSKCDDFAQRENLSVVAMEFCKLNNPQAIILQIQRAEAMRQSNTAWEFLWWGEMSGKISGNENAVKETLFAQLGLSDVFANLKELDAFQAEAGQYEDLAVRTQLSQRPGQSDRLIDEISVYKKTDVRRFNELLAQYLLTPSSKPPVQEAAWPVSKSVTGGSVPGGPIEPGRSARQKPPTSRWG